MSPITEAMKPSRNSDRQSCASSGELFPKNGTASATESPTTFASSRPTIFGSSRRPGIAGNLLWRPVRCGLHPIKAGRRKEDPFTTQLTYRRRDEGPTLLFQTAVEFGNSGGPLVFEGKVIGIVSAVQGGETRGTRIQTVYDALRNWNIASVQRETAPTIENARKALVNNDFGTAQ